MDLETRVTNLEKFINGFAKKAGNSDFYTSADIASIRQVNAGQSQAISENSDAIFDLADVIESLDERVTALEEAQNG